MVCIWKRSSGDGDDSSIASTSSENWDPPVFVECDAQMSMEWNEIGDQKFLKQEAGKVFCRTKKQSIERLSSPTMARPRKWYNGIMSNDPMSNDPMSNDPM
jgi:hypothetical protein